MSDLLLSGLNGNNMLAYLAALGTIRACSLMWPEEDVRLKWAIFEGAWRPILSVNHKIDHDEFLYRLNSHLQNSNTEVFSISDNLTISCSDYRGYLLKAQQKATFSDKSFTDYLAAFGSEIIEAEKNGKRTGQIADTALRTMSGAGHQHFLGFMRELIINTNENHLRDSLFNAWHYSDPGPSMRWDLNDDRRYALRWKEPSGDRILTMRGANRLAIEAMPLMPIAPVRNRLETTGFTQEKKKAFIGLGPYGREASLPIRFVQY